MVESGGLENRIRASCKLDKSKQIRLPINSLRRAWSSLVFLLFHSFLPEFGAKLVTLGAKVLYSADCHHLEFRGHPIRRFHRKIRRGKRTLLRAKI